VGGLRSLYFPHRRRISILLLLESTKVPLRTLIFSSQVHDLQPNVIESEHSTRRGAGLVEQAMGIHDVGQRTNLMCNRVCGMHRRALVVYLSVLRQDLGLHKEYTPVVPSYCTNHRRLRPLHLHHPTPLFCLFLREHPETLQHQELQGKRNNHLPTSYNTHRQVCLSCL